MATERFTAYLTDGERAALRLLARHLGVSENGVIKMLIRDKSGLEIPAKYQYQLEALDRRPILMRVNEWPPSHEKHR